MAVVAVVGLGLAEAFEVKLLVDPSEQLAGGRLAAALGVSLLVADILLPVPSSVVMVAHGALFGVVPGAALSLLGRTGNAAVGVALGRGAGRLLAERSPGTERARGTELVERWGLAAIVLTRPVPVLAESTVIAAGAMRLSAPAIVAAAALGGVPEGLLYAMAGAYAASYASTAIVFVAVIALAGVVWAVAAALDVRRCTGAARR